jgi:hypothetical protein
MQDNAAVETDPYLRRFTRELPVVLNEHENQLYGKMLAEKCKEQELAIEKKKQVTADHNNRIKVITNEIKRLADARAKGEELRPVMCGERLHGNVIEIVRLDRVEVVDTRPADLKDLQTTMPLGGGMPTMPEDFDEGPRGDGLGTLADQPVEEGEIVESSTGDQVYVSDTEDHDEATYVETTDDEPTDAETSGPDNVVRGVYFSGVPGQADGETEDEMIDRKMREREEAEQGARPVLSSPMTQREKDIAQRNKEIEEAKTRAASKPTRERSKTKNGSKGKKK